MKQKPIGIEGILCLTLQLIRTKAEVEEYKEHKDLIVALKTYMLSNRLFKGDFFKEAEKQKKT